MNKLLRNPCGLIVRTQVTSGNAASDKCYVDRNLRTLECEWNQWNQIIAYCRGTNNEGMLKKCLSKSGESDWWKNFDGCSSAEQCLTLSPVDTDG